MADGHSNCWLAASSDGWDADNRSVWWLEWRLVERTA
jgi:hypothetical protein